MIHTQTEIDNLVELAIIQRAELKKLVESLPQLRDHLSSEIERNLEEIEPAIRSELEQFVTARALDAHAQTSTALTAKLDELARSLETTTAARYSVLIAEREKNESLLTQAEARIAEAASALPGSVKEIVAGELARFPRAGEIDQLRKEFAEPKGLNPRGKWLPDETYQRLDLVTVNGDSFVSNIDSNRERPSRSAADWTLNAARGNSGGGGGITSLTDILPIPTSGQILGSEGTSYVPKTLAAGSNITITETPTTITITGDEGQIELQDGTEAAPSLFFVSDTNTGMYRPAADTVGIVGGGHDILRLTDVASATDYVEVKNGIGTGTPLHILAEGASANIGLHLQPKGSGLLTISDGTDFNKGIRFRSSSSAASAVTLIDAVSTAGRVVTLPDATDTLVGRSTTDTLSNKTMIAPALGTPTALIGTNISGTAAGLTAGNVTTNANLTGDVTSVGNATSIAAGVIVNADVNASAAIAYSKLNLATSIVNADISASAAIVDTKLATISTASKVSNSATTATSANTASAIVARDASGNFTAGTITANLTGNVSGSSGSTTGNAATATALATARAINGVNFDGTAAITVTAAAGTLSGNTLASGVTASSLTSLGTIASLTATAGTISTTPTASTDIANKLYVDTVAQGLDAKASCVAATTADITLSGAQTIDGVSVIAGNRVLVKNQTLSQNNGIYLCASGAWTRTTDADTWDELTSAFTFIEQGTVNGDCGFVCTANAGGTLGTTSLPWSQFSGAGTFTAGTGLTLTGSVFSLTSPVAVANGGTGLTSLGSGVATFLGTPSSANLAAAVSDETGSGALVFATSPSLVTPILGTPQSGTLTSCTGLPISTGVSGLGTGVATALAVNVGSAGAPVVNGGALGVPSSGTVTNLTGTASININGTVGATTPSTVAATTIGSSGRYTNTLASGLAIYLNGSGTTTLYQQINNAGGHAFLGLEGSVANTNFTSSDAYALILGTQNATNVNIGVNNTVVGKFTSTGLNSTAVGATTASTGAFTTLSATGNADFGTTISSARITLGHVTNATVDNSIVLRAGSTKTAWQIGAQFNVDNGFEITPSTAVGGTTFTTPVFQVTATGVAVTGTLSATGQLSASKATDTSGASTSISDYSIKLVASQTNTINSIGWAETTTTSAAIVGYDAGSGGAQGIRIYAGSNSSLPLVADFSSTGLAVTGALSSTTGAAVGGATAGAGGIAFPATAVAVADANTLDDYEEGTWTGTMTGLTTAPTTPVTATGKYTKIGNIVTIHIQFYDKDTTGASGQIVVTGLPFLSLNSNQVGSVNTQGLSIPNKTLNSWISGLTTTIELFSAADNVNGSFPNITAGASKSLFINASYFV